MAIKIIIQKLSDLLYKKFIIGAILGIIFGYVIIIYLPKALLSMEFYLISIVFLIILIGLMTGLVMLMLNAFWVLEKIVILVFF
jgi:hypothetical protein